MRLDQFDYNLPPEKIAQRPLERRDASKLLKLERADKTIGEARFSDLPEILRDGDLLVVNNTVVRPFRVRGKKSTGGAVELTLTARKNDMEWEALVKGGNPRPGLRIELPAGLEAELIETTGSEVRVDANAGAPLWRVRMLGEDLITKLYVHGLPPLPPYIRRSPDHDPEPDRERYQTVYARDGEAAAAPTAGLHFSDELLTKLESKGVRVAGLRLDVSYGTFAPVRTERIEDHHMHPESYKLPAETAEAVNRTRKEGGRVVAVGTTAVRTIEHCADDKGEVSPGKGSTSLYIYPGYRFKAVDAMITNFHMPRSTLLVLVAAFAGRELILEAYNWALKAGFRFLSYGDAMIIL